MCKGVLAVPEQPNDDGLVPPIKVMRKRLDGVYSAEGLSGTTRRYIMIVAMLVGLASLPTLAAITAGSNELEDGRTGAMDTPFIPPASAGPVRVMPSASVTTGSGGPIRSGPDSAGASALGGSGIVRGQAQQGRTKPRRVEKSPDRGYGTGGRGDVGAGGNSPGSGSSASGSAKSGSRGRPGKSVSPGEGAPASPISQASPISTASPGSTGSPGWPVVPVAPGTSGSWAPRVGSPDGSFGDAPGGSSDGASGGSSDGASGLSDGASGGSFGDASGGSSDGASGLSDGASGGSLDDASDGSSGGSSGVSSGGSVGGSSGVSSHGSSDGSSGGDQDGSGDGGDGPDRPPAKPAHPPWCLDRGYCPSRPSHHHRPDWSRHQHCHDPTPTAHRSNHRRGRKRTLTVHIEAGGSKTRVASSQEGDAEARDTRQHQPSPPKEIKSIVSIQSAQPDRSDFRRRSEVTERPYNVRPARSGDRTHNSHRHQPNGLDRGDGTQTTTRAYRGSHRVEYLYRPEERTGAHQRSSRMGRHHADQRQDHQNHW
jgi:hypothetical protein